MSQKLFEANFITINTSAWDKPVPASSAKSEEQPAEKTQKTEPTEKSINTNEYPPKATDSKSWTAWGEWLKARLADNKELDQEAKMNSIEITNEFFESFFVTNWGQDVGTKLNAFNKIQNYFIRNDQVSVAAFNPDTSPLLKFLIKEFVINLIKGDKFKSGTFNAMLLAYKDNIVKANEFSSKASEEYNILYCLNLYEKSPSEILEYLKQQQKVLSNSVNIIENKLTFLKTGTIAAFEPDERAKEIKSKIKAKELPADLANIKTCTLNNLDLVKLIAGSDHTTTTSLNSAGQDTVVAKLPTLADKFAAIFALSLTTSSSDAKQALKNNMFGGISAEDKFNAAVRIASSDILPKGQLNKADADTLVAKIISSISKDSN